MKNKKSLSTISAIALLLGAVNNISLPGAHAASTNSLRWNQAASAGIAWAVENKAAEGDYNNFVKYYTPTVKLWQAIAPVGGKVDIEYLVKDASGNPLPNTSVTIVYNPAYSIGTSKSSTLDGADIGLPKGGPNTGLFASMNTDASGKVDFSVINKDSTGDPAIANDGNTTPTYGRDNAYTQIQIFVGAASAANLTQLQTSQDIDILEVHFMKGVSAKVAPAPIATPIATPSATPTATPSATPTATPSATPTATPSATPTATPSATPTATKAPATIPNPTIRLTSPSFTSANSVDSTGDIAQYYSPATKAFYTYLAAGSTVTLTYHATLDGTTPAANKEVDLYVDSAYSGSKANWMSGATKITAPVATDATFGAKLVGTTDAMGNVSFKLTNTNTTGLENAPTTPTQDRAAIKPARLFGTMKPMLAGITSDMAEDTDLITFDIYAAPKALPTSIVCFKGKTIKKVTGTKPVCPKGFTLKK
jgi:hypothetical protein